VSDLVHRYWDQEQLDIQLNARATVPDFWSIMERYAGESARMRASHPCRIGVKYGPGEAERLDIFPALPGRGPAPVFVFIHGGYWRLLDASDSAFMAGALLEAGACVVVVNYALAPAVTLDEITRQCRAALAFVHREAAGFGGDPARIHVSGSSAGGHLAGMLLAPGWHAEFGVPETVIHSASPLSGLFDLEPVRRSHVNGWLNLDEAAARRLSPLLHLPQRPVPLVMSYGASETEEFKRQSEAYAAACAALGCPVEIVMEPGSNHFDLPMRLMDPAAPLTRAVLRAMGL
jgi:arylformamidase